MFKRIFAASLVFGAAALAPPIVHAQTACAPRDSVAERLEQRYGETPAGYGLQTETQVLELWTSAETGSWTLLVTAPSGVTCVVASGQAWQARPPLAETTKGDPA